MRNEGEADGTVRWSVEGNGYVTARGRKRKQGQRMTKQPKQSKRVSGFNLQACIPVYAIVDQVLRRGDKKCGKLAAALSLIVLVDQEPRSP